ERRRGTRIGNRRLDAGRLGWADVRLVGKRSAPRRGGLRRRGNRFPLVDDRKGQRDGRRQRVHQSRSVGTVELASIATSQENSMKKISTAELKKAILAVEAERAKHPAAFRPDRAQRATLQKSRQASDKMTSGFLKEAGLDLKKFQALQEQRSVELERMVAQHKTDALRLAKQRKGTLHSSIAAQSKALADLGARSDFFPYPTFTLDTPFLIWTIPLTDIADSAAVPFGSWAKFDFKTSQTLDQKVGFYFYWANPYGDYAVINAATFMSASGHLRAHAPWGLGVNTSSVEADALFNLWFGWPTGVVSSTYDAAYLGSIGAMS